jgi:anti-sigma regulatory factor (Ser/Thr protein kinase)
LATVRHFPADSKQLVEVRRFIADQVRGSSHSENESDLLLAVNEAAANAIRHSGSPSFSVSWSNGAETARIEVRDLGIFRPNMLVAEERGAAGRGIPMMMALTDRFEIEPGTEDQPGTVVRLYKKKS